MSSWRASNLPRIGIGRPPLSASPHRLLESQQPGAGRLRSVQTVRTIIRTDRAEPRTGVEVDDNICDRLIRHDPKDVTKLVGGVAESWTARPDGKGVTFKLRPGLTLTDGTPVTADDAAFSPAHVVKLNLSPRS